MKGIAGTMKSFVINDDISITSWQLKIQDVKTKLEKMWLLVRYVLKEISKKMSVEAKPSPIMDPIMWTGKEQGIRYTHRLRTTEFVPALPLPSPRSAPASGYAPRVTWDIRPTLAMIE